MKQPLLNSVFILWLLCHLLTLIIPVETKINKTYLKQIGCDIDLRSQNLSADFIIAGIFPARKRKVNDDGTESYDPSYVGINWISAMLYAIDQINNDANILPGVPLGYDIRDSCGKPEIAVQHTLNYLLDVNYFKPTLSTTSSQNSAVKSNDTAATTAENPDAHNGLCIDRKNATSTLVGVIGGASSPVSSIISTILSVDYIPQISYASTSADLSEKRWKYRNFLRTVPSDKHQARAIVDLIAYFRWSYISAFAIDDEYGRVGLDELIDAAKEKNICLATAHFFHQDIINPKMKDKLDHILEHLTEFGDKSHIVILWSSFLEADYIIREAERRNLTHITWVGTEIWSETLNSENEKTFHTYNQDVIYLEISQPPVMDYINFMTKTTVRVSWQNAWFRKRFKPFCPPDVYHRYTPGERKKYKCLFPQLLPHFARSIVTTKKRKYPQVIAAVYTLAYGLHIYLNCTKTECTIPKGGIDYKKLLDVTRICDFIVPNTTNYRVSFNKTTGEVKQKQYDYVIRRQKTKPKLLFGTWHGPGNLSMSKSETEIWGEKGIPEGRCSETCLPGSYKLNGSSSCCWSCPKCLENTISTSENQYRCRSCRTDYEVANDNHTVCIRLREIRITVNDYVGLLLLSSCVVGVLITLFIIAVFIRFWDTPLMKSSSREISIIQLVSLLLLFCLPVMYFFRLSPILCMLRTLVFGFLFTTVVSIILVKTYRLIRVFDTRFTKVSRFLRNRYQILFIYALVVFEIIGIVFWNWNFEPAVLREVRLLERIFYLTCDRFQIVIFWIVLLYIFVLTLFTGYVAFRARKLPEIYNDAQFISLAMFTACIIWIAYVPLFFSLSPYENNIAFLVENFVCTLSLTVILFSYKIKVVLFQPHRNSLEHVRKAQHEHFLESFQKDVSKRQNSIPVEIPEQRPRLSSLPTAVHKPSVFDAPDAAKLSPQGKGVHLHRRASFSSMSNLESTRLFKSYDTFAALEALIEQTPTQRRPLTKSQSTPFLFDEAPLLDDKNHGKRLKPTLSHGHHNQHHHFSFSAHFGVLGRVLSHVSINKLLHHHDHEHKQETRILLSSSSSDKGLDTKL